MQVVTWCGNEMRRIFSRWNSFYDIFINVGDEVPQQLNKNEKSILKKNE